MDSRLETIFNAALNQNSYSEQSAYLEGACGGDSDLRRQVEQLLADYKDGEFLEGKLLAERDQVKSIRDSHSDLGGPATLAHDSLSLSSKQIGPYRLRELLGEGGMGSVYVAEQTKPVRRKVALKIIKPGMGSREVISRFESERQALAMMDHQNIARILDAGATEQGLPFFVMELVRGLPITQYCDQSNTGIRDRMALFIDVCHAIQHAHQKGIIHRDIKPSNVLVTLHDGKPIVKVIDFGVAKALHQPLSQLSIYTAFNQIIGTPLYMSPEQLELSGLDIDTRTDIYSLGVLLYELLTGRTPFDQEHLMKSGFDEMRRIIREDEPPRPSQRVTTLPKAELSTTANRRGLDDRSFSKSVASEIDWMISKAMEKDRNRRYENASGFAEDIQRYLNDEPVLACPPSWKYRLQKFARKHRASIGIAGILLSGLVIGLMLTTWQWRRALVAEQGAVESKLLLEQQVRLADKRLALAEQTIDDMYTRFASDWISQQSGLSAVQQEFLEKALATYEKLAADDRMDVMPRLGSFVALYRASLIHQRLGNLDKATQGALALIEMADRVTVSNPDNVDCRLYRSRARLLLSSIHDNRGETAKKIEYCDTVWNELQEIGQRQDLTADQRRMLAACTTSLAGALASIRSREQLAREVADRSVQLARILVEDTPKNFDSIVTLASSLQSKGTQCLWWGKENEVCLSAYQESKELWRRLAEERPDYRTAIASQASILQNMAIVMGRMKRTDDAFAARIEQCGLLREYCIRFPDHPREISMLGDVLRVLANAEETKGNHAKADEYWTECLDRLNLLVERFPNYRMGRSALAMAINDHGFHEKKNGELEQAKDVLQMGRERLRLFTDKYPDDREMYVFQIQILRQLAGLSLEQANHALAASTAIECVNASLEERKAAIRGEDVINPKSYWGSVATAVYSKNVIEQCLGLLRADRTISEIEKQGIEDNYSNKLHFCAEEVARALMELVQVENASQDFWAKLSTQVDATDSWKAFVAKPSIDTLLSRSQLEINALILDALQVRYLQANDLPKFWPEVAIVMASNNTYCPRPDELLAICRRGLAQMPDDASAKQALAWTLFRCGQDSACRELLEGDSVNPENGFILSMALARLGEKELAQVRFDQGSLFLETEKEMLEARRAHAPAPQQPNLETLLRLQSEAAIALQYTN
jgi:eukaryotic-like serine/threonine-protein kinase